MVQEIHVTWFCPKIVGDPECDHMTTDMVGRCLHCGHIGEHRSEVVVDRLDDTYKQWESRVLFLITSIESAEEECSYCGGSNGTEREVIMACNPLDEETVAVVKNLL